MEYKHSADSFAEATGIGEDRWDELSKVAMRIRGNISRASELLEALLNEPALTEKERLALAIKIR